jgi:ABC-type multidrug transport system fused ATPase/permease subunit
MVAMIVYYGGLMLNEGSITAGTLTTFLLYAIHVAGALTDLSGFYTSLMTGMSASQRVQEVIETDWSKEEEDEEEGVTEAIDDKVILIVKGNIRFHSVSFAYPSRLDMPALNDINLDIPAGKTFAIFGASGSGKSTLAALILRLYDVPGT